MACEIASSLKRPWPMRYIKLPYVLPYFHRIVILSVHFARCLLDLFVYLFPWKRRARPLLLAC